MKIIRSISYVMSILLILLLYAYPAFFQQHKPSYVSIKKQGDKYRFYVNGKPFIVKGVGLDFDAGNNFKALKEAGGNTFRTWRTRDAEQELDSAAKYDLMVAMGLDIKKELHDFDYNDEKPVAKQLEQMKKIVAKYKDHPNLLCWIAGNELNLLFDRNGKLKPVNPKVYEALADLVDYIHKIDPNHPVTFTFAGIMKAHIQPALARCPQIDFLSFQVYGGLATLQEQIEKAGVTRPYMVTEFGPMGHWEVPVTSWKREIEESSSAKARGIAERIQKGFTSNNSGLCLGGFAFIWGQKQERTPTWYGMFCKSGEATATVDELTRFWTGSYPANRAPRVDSVKLNNKRATDHVYVKPGKEYNARVWASEPEQDPLTYKWVIMKEVMKKSKGGEKEIEPDTIDFKVTFEKDGVLSFITPPKKGEYRLLVYVYDGKGKAGTANIPFYVK